MKPFFTPDDFDRPLVSVEHHNEAMARIANAKIERDGIKVKGWINRLVGHEFAEKYSGTTHTALLINIEPREQCTHPINKLSMCVKTGSLVVVDEIKIDDTFLSLVFLKCECGAQVEVDTFKEVK